jgi:hypothetical protein
VGSNPIVSTESQPQVSTGDQGRVHQQSPQCRTCRGTRTTATVRAGATSSPAWFSLASAWSWCSPESPTRPGSYATASRFHRSPLPSEAPPSSVSARCWPSGAPASTTPTGEIVGEPTSAVEYGVTPADAETSPRRGGAETISTRSRPCDTRCIALQARGAAPPTSASASPVAPGDLAHRVPVSRRPRNRRFSETRSPLDFRTTDTSPPRRASSLHRAPSCPPVTSPFAHGRT